MQHRSKAFMRKPGKALILATVWLALGLTASCAHEENRPKAQVAAPQQSCHAVTRETCKVAHSLGRGINLGNMLEAPREGDWGVKAEPRYVNMAAAKFQTVRVPVRWSNHAAPTADATIDEAFARRVDRVVDELLARGAYVVLNVHHYSQINGGDVNRGEFRVDPAVVDTRLVNLWKQIAERYRDRSPKLVFELLNEPHGRLDGEPWNALAARVLATVRASNPDRVVMIGPSNWNNVNHLPRLRLPRDRNLIVSIHNYDPFDFTHQGVTWRPKPFPAGKPCCSEAQRRKITEALDAATAWNREHGVPLHLGEFGAYKAADMHSRETYTRLVRDEAERRGIGWAYWELASEFGVYSPEERTWVEPLRRALLD